MTSDPDDALSWDGEERAAPRKPTPQEQARPQSDQMSAPDDHPVGNTALPDGWNTVGKGSGAVDHLDGEADEVRRPLSTAMLLFLGVVGGIYLLYSAGWMVGGLRLRPLASFLVADAMFLPWFVLAVAAPLLWFVASWVLTRDNASWLRVGALILGIVLLVPWPFVTVGAFGL